MSSSVSPAVATSFAVNLGSSSGTVGDVVPFTVAPVGGAWPDGVLLMPVVTGFSNGYTTITSRPTGTMAAQYAFPLSVAATGTLSVSASGMSGPAAITYQARAAGTSTPSPTPTPTPTPTPSPTPAPTPAPTPEPASTSDSTLPNLPSTIVAGQPLSAVTYTPTQATPSYFVLFNVTTGAEEGLRWQNGVMRSKLELLIPQTAATYTVRGFAAASGGTPTYESAQIAVTAAPGALPATPVQAADTGATSSGVTTNWTATAASYHVLARPGVGSAYGSLADATVTTNSYTFTGRPANSSPRAVVIPQNANGYGPPSGQFLSFTTA